MPPNFSQRKGLKPIKDKIQIESMDDELNRRLWDTLYVTYLVNVRKYDDVFKGYVSFDTDRDMTTLVAKMWVVCFGKTIDSLTDRWFVVRNSIKSYFSSRPWQEVYDFIEFVANNYPNKDVNAKFMEECNAVLEKELSAYRFVDGRIVEITTTEEITEIEQALRIPINPINHHLKQALDLFADRKNPDYRNSIKESISAVEAVCRLIAKDDNATLGKALDEIERAGTIELPPALKGAFDKLYGYTSDKKDGIRHAMMDKPNVSPEDAKFMLVSCSAFINYLMVKASKAGITV